MRRPTNEQWQREAMRRRFAEQDPIYAEQLRLGRLLATEDAENGKRRQRAKKVGGRPAEGRQRTMAKERALRQIETEAADEMTAHWISANVSGARLDEMAVEWHWKLSALARQNKQINRSKGRRSDLAVILGSPEAIQQRTRENQELKKKIASALHHIEWLHWVVDGYSLEGASENYDPGGSCDQEILDEILRRASGVRRLPWEKESK